MLFGCKNTSITFSQGNLYHRKANVQENKFVKVTRAGLKGSLLLAFMIGTHSLGWGPRIFGGIVAGAGMGLLGYRKGSLSSSGALCCG